MQVPIELVGGFNPFEKYESKWESSPIFGLKIKMFATITNSTFSCSFLKNFQTEVRGSKSANPVGLLKMIHFLMFNAIMRPRISGHLKPGLLARHLGKLMYHSTFTYFA